MTFTVFPAVDISDGRCVQLRRGEIAAATIYYEDPADAARRWVDEGASMLHIVDLDAALGRGSNTEAVARVVDLAGVPVQVAGGIRDPASLHRALSTGADRVVVGTMAMDDPELFDSLLDRHPGKVVLAADVRDGEVTVAGWTRGTARPVTDVVRELAGRHGIAGVLVTDVTRDGVLQGPNVELYRELAGIGALPVIASGGVRDTSDVAALAASGAVGVVIGTALYEGRLRLSDALTAAGTG